MYVILQFKNMRIVDPDFHIHMSSSFLWQWFLVRGMIVSFVDIGGSVEHHCVSFFKISYRVTINNIANRKYKDNLPVKPEAAYLTVAALYRDISYSSPLIARHTLRWTTIICIKSIQLKNYKKITIQWIIYNNISQKQMVLLTYWPVTRRL